MRLDMWKQKQSEAIGHVRHALSAGVASSRGGTVLRQRIEDLLALLESQASPPALGKQKTCVFFVDRPGLNRDGVKHRAPCGAPVVSNLIVCVEHATKEALVQRIEELESELEQRDSKWG